MSPGPADPQGYEIVERRPAYQGFFRLDVVRLRHRRFDGEWSQVITRELFAMRRAATVLPWDPVSDRVVLVEQFRTGAIDICERPWMLEACAGLAEGSEPAEDIARRECFEESGLMPRRLAWACDYASSPGATTEKVSVYVGEVTAPASGGIYGKAEEGEDIRTHVLPFAEALAMVGDGRIIAITAVVSLFWLQANHARLREAWS
ncbi:MAG: NUDIX domain-containing protein [Geminicoccaceae bacterium]